MITGGAEYVYGIPYVNLPQFAQVKPIGTNVVPAHEGVNHEALDEILSYIKAHPQTWRQESWYRIVDPETGDMQFISQDEEVTQVNSCGAAFCFAGHAAIRAGFPSPPLDNRKEWVRKVVTGPEEWNWYYQAVDDFANNVLGLTDSQGMALFHQNNEIRDLEVMIQILHKRPDISGFDLDEVRWQDRMTADEFLDWMDKGKPEED